MAKWSTNNPLIHKDVFASQAEPEEKTATLNGLVNRALLLCILSFASAVAFWELISRNIVDNTIQHGLGWWFFIAPFATLALAQILFHYPRWSAVLSLGVAVLMGIFCGLLSGIAETADSGIVLQATLVVFGTFIGLLLSYKFKFIEVNDLFVAGLMRFVSALLTIALLDAGLSILFLHWRSLVAGYTPVSIFFCVCIYIVGGAMLLISFDETKELLKSKAPKYMEWYGAFAIYSSVLWLYIAILFVIGGLRKRS